MSSAEHDREVLAPYDLRMDGPRLTELERDVLDRLASAWNAFVELERRAESDSAEFAAAIHRAQNLIALRVARRVDPDVWRQP